MMIGRRRKMEDAEAEEKNGGKWMKRRIKTENEDGEEEQNGRR